MKQKNLSKGTLLGYLFIIIISFMYGFVNTKLEFSGIVSTLTIFLVAMLFIAFICFTGKYTLKSILSILLLLFIACISYATTKETVFLIMIMTAVVSSELDYKIEFKVIFYERICILALIIVLSILGLLPINEVSIIKGGSTEVTTGYGLGFNHPNQLAYNIGFLILIYICYKNEKIKQYNIFIAFIVGLLGYTVTKSRTLIILLVVIVLLLELYKGKRTRKIFETIFIKWKVSLWIIPMCAIAALGLPIMMNLATGRLKTALYAFNGFMGSRFTHSSRVLELYPVTLFGGISNFDLLQINYGYSVVDNGYLNLLYNFGILGFFIFFALYFFSIRKLIEKKNYIYLISIMVISFWGVTENILRSFAINFTIIFWSECIDYIKIETNKRRHLLFKRKVRIHI